MVTIQKRYERYRQHRNVPEPYVAAPLPTVYQ